jgi:hypothetical protein
MFRSNIINVIISEIMRMDMDGILIPRMLSVKDALIDDTLNVGIVVVTGKISSILDDHALTVLTKLIKWTSLNQ